MSSSQSTLDEAALREHLARTVFGIAADRPELFGLEVELFPHRWAAGADAPQHVPIHTGSDGRPGTLQLVEAFATCRGLKVKTPEGHVTGACPPPREGDFTFEPGGQPEFSGAPHPSPAAAYDDVAAVLDALRAFASARGVDLLTIGFDPWLDAGAIGLNTGAARYRCMDAVYESIGPYGRKKMRQTATIHVNLDFGGPERLRRRWLAAQLLAPLALATFAYSPFAERRPMGFASYRGRCWTEVDPSRCGFPARLLADPDSDPVDQYLEFALAARVLMVQLEDGSWEAQTAPLSFRRWLREGRHGLYPELTDWAQHLTTLFPEVRPRAFVELRSADSQARAFWPVPLTWWTALLCDDVALDQVLALLAGSHAQLPARYASAARAAAGDAELGETAVTLYRIAEQALPRLPAGWISAEMERAFAVFGERFTHRRRTPADELLERAGEGGPTRATIAGFEERWCELAGTEIGGAEPEPAATGCTAPEPTGAPECKERQ